MNSSGSVAAHRCLGRAFWLAFALAVTSGLAAVCSTRAEAQSVDSLVALLASDNVRVRQSALVTLDNMPPAALAGAPATAIITLLEREALGLATAAEADSIDADDDSYGEYVIALSDVALRLHDVRALRGLALLGIETSRDAQVFVASQGAAALPALDEAWRTTPTARPSVITTYGLMLAGTHATLSGADFGGVVARLLASDDTFPVSLASAAEAGQVVLLSPVIRQLAQDEPGDGVRNYYLDKAAALNSIARRLSPRTLLDDLRTWATGFCTGSTGERAGACHALEAQLDNAKRHVTAGRRTAALNALDAATKIAADAERHGALSHLEFLLVSENTATLRSRL